MFLLLTICVLLRYVPQNWSHDASSGQMISKGKDPLASVQTHITDITYNLKEKHVLDIMVPVDLTGATNCSLIHRYMTVTIDMVTADQV